MSLYVPKTRPYLHQKIVLDASWNEEFYGFLMEMGTGKSKVGIDTICMLREHSSLKRVLIIAPKGTYANWMHKEIPAHMPERHLETTILHLWKGGTASETANINQLMKKNDYLKILVMNIEALASSIKAIKLAEDFVKQGDCMLIVDESSTIKNPTAMRTKKLIKLSRYAKWRRIATGSPVTKSPLDLWAQFEFLKAGCLGFKSYYAFRNRFAILETKNFGGRNIDMVVGHRDTDAVSKLIAKYAAVIKKEDCLDLPPKVFENRYVELTPEQKTIYADILNFATAQIDNGVFVTATQVITQILRLHQVVCGHVVADNGEIMDIPTNKLDVLKSIVEETEGKNIIWCSYRRDIDKVIHTLTKMGRKVVRYDGSTSQEQRSEAIYRFQGRAAIIKNGQVVGERVCPDNERADDFVGTPHAGGYGITLTEANTVIYYSNSYDLEKRMQSEDRAHRIGQTKSVLYIDLIAKGTVEEKIVKVLKAKENLANLIMNGPASIKEFLK